MPIGPPKPVFFATPAELRRWFAANHAKATELWVGYRKRATGKPSVTWPESVDQALCFGWIDGIRKRVDEDSYTIRFTPRRPGSVWSAINLGRVEALTAAKQMKPAGLAVFAARKPERSGYSYEQRKTATLPPPFRKRLRENPAAAAFYAAQPPGYQRLTAFWVMDAKREETRERRFTTLLAECAAGRRIGLLSSPAARPKP